MQKKSIKVSACFLTHLRKSTMANKITGRLMERNITCHKHMVSGRWDSILCPKWNMGAWTKCWTSRDY